MAPPTRVEGDTSAQKAEERTGAGIESIEARRIKSALRQRIFHTSDGPVKVGRFELQRRLGAGGMGIVYLARDPDLDREVAIKIIHDDVNGVEGRQRSRFVREAQTLARLSHPNVVTVYEVGEQDRRLFIAMEHVPGRTLQQWLGEAPRPTHEVLEAFLAAGDGLVAAHEAGVVHRDFKPANVIVGEDGRVRVLDFGLARPETAENPIDEEAKVGSVSHLTQTGAAVGTPIYMAPEQHDREPVDARADQFAFCVALYEALTGRLPFQGGTRAQVRAAIDRGPAQLPATVPGHVRAALVRGLAVAPEERFAGMPDLLGALRDDPGRRRRRWFAAGGSVAALGVAAAAGAVFTQPDPVDPCADTGAAVRAVWDDDERQRARSRIPSHDWERVLGRIDAWADAWATHSTDNCEATHERHEQPVDRMRLRETCLQQRLQRLEVGLALMRGGVPGFERMPENERWARMAMTRGAYALPRLEDCESPSGAVVLPPLPTDSDARERELQLRRRVIATELLEGNEVLLDTAPALLADIDETTQPVLAARVHYALGWSMGARGDLAANDRHREIAYELAERGGDDAIAGMAAAERAGPRGTDREFWIRVALAKADRLRSSPLTVVVILNRIGNAYRDFDSSRAIEFHERAVALAEDALGDHAYLASPLNNLGNDYRDNFYADRCVATEERRLALLERIEGRERTSSLRLGECLALRGDVERGFAMMEDVAERADNPTEALLQQAITAHDLGDVERARALFARTLMAAAAAGDGPGVAFAHTGLAFAARRSAEYDATRAHAEAALREPSPGPRVGYYAHRELAVVAAETGSVDEAQLEMKHAIAAWNGSPAMWLGDAVEIALTTDDLASLPAFVFARGHGGPQWFGMSGTGMVRLGLYDLARPRLEAALELRDRCDCRRWQLAWWTFALAEALWETDDDRLRARTLAEDARAELAAEQGDHARRMAHMDEWLATHHRPPAP